MSEKAAPMPGLTYQDVLQILRLIDAAPGSSLDIEFEGTKLAVERWTGTAGPPPAETVVTARPSSPPATPDLAASPVAPAPVAPAPARPDADDFPDAVAVRPPMTGTFYAASSPGAPPFVSVGDTVKEGDQVGIVEVMKLFTTISAPVDGTVRAILVGNQELVEKDATLMLIEPSN